MRVLLASAQIHLPEGTGGLQVNTDALSKALQASGAEVSVYCRFRLGPLQARARRVFRNFLSSAPRLDTVYGYPVYRATDTIRSAADVVSLVKPDVVVVQGYNAHLLAKTFVRQGLPTLIYMHDVQRFAYDEELSACRKLFFSVNSRFTASLHPDKHVSLIIPPLIDPDAFRVESTRASVLFVNPLWRKGVGVALGLARARPDVAFDFYDCWALDSADRAEVRRLKADLPNVRRHAVVTDMRQAYGSARLVLFPSEMETWGRVASEGHVSGIPTLGSDRGALPDTIGAGGVCVPFDAPIEAWLEAFSELWDDASRYNGYVEAATRMADRDEIRVETIVGGLTDLFQSMVA